MTRTSLVCAGNRSRVTVQKDGQPVATADIFEDSLGIQVRFNIEHGHLPMQVRRQLVDAVFDLPTMRTIRTVRASIPLGDVDLLNGLRSHCARIDTRAAGSTCLVDAVVEDQSPGR